MLSKKNSLSLTRMYNRWVYNIISYSYRFYKYIIIYFLVFIRIGHAGGCFLKRCGDRVIGVTYTHTHTTHTHNGFTPDTRRVVGRPDSTWREVSVRSTGFHYPWTGRRQPGGTPAAGGIQREIRLTLVEPVSAAGARRLCGDCHLHHHATSQR